MRMTLQRYVDEKEIKSLIYGKEVGMLRLGEICGEVTSVKKWFGRYACETEHLKVMSVINI